MVGLHNIDAPIQSSPNSQQVERYYLPCPVWLIYLWLSLNIVEHLYIFEYFHIFEYLYIFEYLNIFVYLWIFLNIFTYHWISLTIFEYLWLSLNIFAHLFDMLKISYSIFLKRGLCIMQCIFVKRKKTFPVSCFEGEILSYIAILQYCNIESYGRGQRPRGGNDQHSVILGNIPICAHFSFLRIKT